jgi:hypothetical protein
MNTFNLRIADCQDGEISIESTVVAGDLEGPVTPAMVVMSYLGANMPRIMEEAVVWARGVVQRQERDSVVMPPEKSLVLPS